MTDRQFYVALHVAIVCAFFAILFASKSYFNVVERAAYLEGRYSLDHFAAVQLAASEEVR